MITTVKYAILLTAVNLTIVNIRILISVNLWNSLRYRTVYRRISPSTQTGVLLSPTFRTVLMSLYHFL